MEKLTSSFFVETTSRKIIQVNGGLRKMFNLGTAENTLVGQNSTCLLLSISKNFLDIEKFGEFYSRSLDKREKNDIQNIRINEKTNASVSYFYNKLFSCHYWEFSFFSR